MAVKLQNKILKEWIGKTQQTVQQLCIEMSVTESVLGEKCEQLMKSMEQIPLMFEPEKEKLLKEIHELNSVSSDEDIVEYEGYSVRIKIFVLLNDL